VSSSYPAPRAAARAHPYYTNASARPLNGNEQNRRDIVNATEGRHIGGERDKLAPTGELFVGYTASFFNLHKEEVHF
jgi:hypothetical protein